MMMSVYNVCAKPMALILPIKRPSIQHFLFLPSPSRHEANRLNLAERVCMVPLPMTTAHAHYTPLHGHSIPPSRIIIINV